MTDPGWALPVIGCLALLLGPMSITMAVIHARHDRRRAREIWIRALGNGLIAAGGVLTMASSSLLPFLAALPAGWIVQQLAPTRAPRAEIRRKRGDR